MWLFIVATPKLHAQARQEKPREKFLVAAWAVRSFSRLWLSHGNVKVETYVGNLIS